MRIKRLVIRKLSIALALAVLFSACSELFSPTKIYSPEAISTLANDLEILGEDYLIEEVHVSEKMDFTGNFGDVTVYMRDTEGQWYLYSLYYKMGIPHDGPTPRSRTVRGELPHAINIDDIVNRKENIEKYAEAAIAQFKEEFESEYKFESIGKLLFKADQNGELQIQIFIFATEKGKPSTREEGRRIVKSYYEFVFDVDKNGTVVYIAD